MSNQNRISAIYDLAQFFSFVTNGEVAAQNQSPKYDALKIAFESKLQLAEIQNPWFTKDNLHFCLQQWAEVLTLENLNNWAKNCVMPVQPKKIGIIMAGNIPLVGLHDLLSVLVSGHQALVKTSSKDNVLMEFVMDFLKDTDEDLNQAIQKVEKLQNQDAVIATGSNNTARYFEYYFKDIPHIIRKNRTSVAVLDGQESKEDLINLAEDIFRYFGLGCRNVTKLYLPKNYNTDVLFEAFYDWNPMINHTKYANNYDYNRAIYLMSKENFLDNNFVILKPSNQLHSPIGVIHYHFYDDLESVKSELVENQNQIQCVVGNLYKEIPQILAFGQTQKPSLTDYADGVDILQFLNDLN